MKVSQILEQLAATSSRNDKLAILQKHVDHKELKLVMWMTLNPFINYYIRKIPLYAQAERPTMSLDKALVDLLALSDRDVTGNAAIEHLQHILGSVSEDDARVIIKIIERDLACGVQESTANKVWTDLIPSYPCMLCSPCDEKTLAKISYPAMAQLKMDAMRFNAIVTNGAVEFRTRNGKELDLHGFLEKEFLELAGDRNVVFDGELYVRDKDGKPLPRQTTNGIMSKAQRGTMSVKEAASVGATLWDEILYDEFTAGKGHAPYSRRHSSLLSRLESIGASTPFNRARDHKLRLVDSHTVNSFEDAQKLFEEYLAKGEEGIILKNLSSFWEDKRVKHQVKFKGELETDLLCIGWEEGTGKNVGRLGALVLQSSDGDLVVKVGTGFNDQDRESITAPDVVGKVVSIKYNCRIIDKKTGVHSLFLPVFIEVRHDKTKADHSKDIK